MKNKLLVSVFAMAIAAFALTSCNRKSDVKDVSTDLLKETLHGSVRSLSQLDGETLTLSEYEFPSANVNDNRLIYRTITFGNGKSEPKKVENLTYQYGEWSEDATKFSLFVTPANGSPYTLWFRSNAFFAPDGKVFNLVGARVEKWEKSISSLSNSDWEYKFMDELTVDSIIDTIYKSILPPFNPPYKYKYDTVYYEDSVNVLAADTTCSYEYIFNHDASTFANTGKYRCTSVRSKYDRKTATSDTISKTVLEEFDFEWFFSDVTSDAKFTIVVRNTDKEEKDRVLEINKFKTDVEGKSGNFLLDGHTYELLVKKP